MSGYNWLRIGGVMKWLILFLPLLLFGEWKGDTCNIPLIEAKKVITDTVGTPGTAKADSIQLGGGGVIIKIIKVNSHLAIILSGSDTLWAAADTTNF